MLTCLEAFSYSTCLLSKASHNHSKFHYKCKRVKLVFIFFAFNLFSFFSPVYKNWLINRTFYLFSVCSRLYWIFASPSLSSLSSSSLLLLILINYLYHWLNIELRILEKNKKPTLLVFRSTTTAYVKYFYSNYHISLNNY